MNLKMIINSYGLQIGVIAMTTINMCLVLKLKEKFKNFKDLVYGIQNDFNGSFKKTHDELISQQSIILREMDSKFKEIDSSLEEVRKQPEPKYIKVKKAGRPRKNKSAK